MKYDFETIVNRKEQGAYKWRRMSQEDIAKGLVPLSVADMEFKTAPEIVEGLKKHLDSDILGYTGPTDRYYEVVSDFLMRHHQIKVKKEECIITQGVVAALFFAVMTFTKPNDGVCILSPVYYPFANVIDGNKRNVVRSVLKYDGSYTIDFEDLEEKLARDDVSMMIFCSPHNPVGRVWRKEEVLKVLELCKKHNVFLVSDEIHMDLLMPGYKHVSSALFEEYRDNMMLCTSCSKTFNLAGMSISNIFIFNEERRKAYLGTLDIYHAENTNNMAYKALELAYTQGEAWYQELLEVLNHNRLLVKSYLETNLPKAKVVELEGTYLQWIDLTYLDCTPQELEAKMNENSVYLDEGYIFGEGGEMFERVTLACPTKALERCLGLFVKAVKECEHIHQNN